SPTFILHHHVPVYLIVLHHTRLLLFFFSYYLDHRHLHSFPTRRSSDLLVHQANIERLRRADEAAGEDDVLGPCGPDEPRQPLGRSEEHTSELQSRFDLVCRLLLEKKKKKLAMMHYR